jgi:hypothetical protein
MRLGPKLTTHLRPKTWLRPTTRSRPIRYFLETFKTKTWLGHTTWSRPTKIYCLVTFKIIKSKVEAYNMVEA